MAKDLDSIQKQGGDPERQSHKFKKVPTIYCDPHLSDEVSLTFLEAFSNDLPTKYLASSANIDPSNPQGNISRTNNQGPFLITFMKDFHHRTLGCTDKRHLLSATSRSHCILRRGSRLHHHPYYFIQHFQIPGKPQTHLPSG